MNHCLVLVAVASCGGAVKSTDETRPTNALAVRVDPDECTCARLEAPLQIPSGDLPRWRQAAREIEAMVAELAAAFEAPMTPSCPRPLDERIREVLLAHAHALDEHRALNAASCDHFARWLLDRPDRSEQFVEDLGTVVDKPTANAFEHCMPDITFASSSHADRLPAACRELTSEVRQVLGELTITRTCS